MSIPIETSLRQSAYTNGYIENEMTFPIMQELPSVPTFGLFECQTERSFAEFTVRSTKPVVAIFYSSDDDGQLALLRELSLYLPSNSPIVAVDSQKTPAVVCTFGWPDRPTPFIARLFKTHVIRFMDGPLNTERILLFADSTRQWRNQGFYPQEQTS